MSARPCSCGHDRASHFSDKERDPQTGSYEFVWLACLARGCEDCKRFTPRKEKS